MLLILAGISIATLTGENGLLTKAEYAKKTTEEKAREEEKNLDEINNYIETNTQGTPKVKDPNPGIFEGEGTETNPYVINSIEDLVTFSKEVNQGNSFSGKYINLGIDLDFNSSNSYMNPNTQAFGDINLNGKTETLKEELTTGRGFVPIGNYNTSELPFSGEFNGNKKFIRNLYINVSQDIGECDAGLFGYLKDGTVKDLYLKNCDIYVKDKLALVGGIAGVQDGTILRSSVSGKVKVFINTGGVAGAAGGIAGNCSLEGNNASIEECYNTAEISIICKVEKEENLVNSSAGGIVGTLQSKTVTVKNCYNKGNVSSKSNNQAAARRDSRTNRKY